MKFEEAIQKYVKIFIEFVCNFSALTHIDRNDLALMLISALIEMIDNTDLNEV